MTHCTFSQPRCRFSRNVFCATGEGGGVDPTCSPKYKVKGTTDDKLECEHCGKTHLKKTVALGILDAEGNETGEVKYCGTTCASKLMKSVGQHKTGAQIKREAEIEDSKAKREAEYVQQKYDSRVVGDKGKANHEYNKTRLPLEGSLFLQKEDKVVRVNPNAHPTEQQLYDRLLDEGFIANVFCPTGEGGGVDPTCSPPDGAKARMVSVKKTSTDHFDVSHKGEKIGSIKKVNGKWQGTFKTSTGSEQPIGELDTMQEAVKRVEQRNRTDEKYQIKEVEKSDADGRRTLAASHGQDFNEYLSAKDREEGFTVRKKTVGARSSIASVTGHDYEIVDKDGKVVAEKTFTTSKVVRGTGATKITQVAGVNTEDNIASWVKEWSQEKQKPSPRALTKTYKDLKFDDLASIAKAAGIKTQSINKLKQWNPDGIKDGSMTVGAKYNDTAFKILKEQFPDVKFKILYDRSHTENRLPDPLKRTDNHNGPGPHKSGTPQSSHGRRVDQADAKEALKISKRTGEHTGVTYQPLLDDSPKVGKSVSIYPEAEEAISPEELSEKRIFDYMMKNRTKFRNKKIHFGGWFDKEADKYYLDLVVVVDSDEEATALAKSHNQEAYYDLETGKEIFTKDQEDRRLAKNRRYRSTGEYNRERDEGVRKEGLQANAVDETNTNSKHEVIRIIAYV